MPRYAGLRKWKRRLEGREVMAEETKDHSIRREMERALEGGTGPKAARFALACLGGMIPAVGGAFGAAANAWSERAQEKFNKIFAAWLKLQEEEIREIGVTLAEVILRLDSSDPQIEQRVQSPEYLSLVKKCFRDWSAAESENKRVLIRNLLANAAACSLTTDDVLRLFIEWIGKYSEAHFKVIACVYRNTGISRQQIWTQVHGVRVREDSAEADLFKTIIHDLTVGHVIRQHRETDANGQFLKKARQSSRGSMTRHMKSAFDDNEQYELTGLGRQFVHYTMNEVVPKLAGGHGPTPASDGELEGQLILQRYKSSR